MKSNTLIHIGVGAALLAVAACKTTGDDDSGGLNTTATGYGAEAALLLTQDEASALYLKMLAVELAAGISVPQDRLHSVSGLVECGKTQGAVAEATPMRCEVRVRLSAPAALDAASATLSGTQPLPDPLAERITTFATSLRADLDVQKTAVLADAACDFIGKKSPPFDVEDVQCKVQHPRLPTEAIFDGRLAEELAELSRGTVVFGTGQASVEGALQCRLVEGSDRASCMVRPGSAGTLSNVVKPLSAAHSLRAARGLFDAAGDRAQIGAGGSPRVGIREASGMLRCNVDSGAVVDGGERRVVCRVAL